MNAEQVSLALGAEGGGLLCDLYTLLAEGRGFRLDAVDPNEWHVMHRNRDANSSRRNEAEETVHSRRLASISMDSSVDNLYL